MIFCFSGTGNSRYVSRRIAESLDKEIIDLNIKIKSCDNSAIKSDENIVIVTPTYAWRIPRIVYEWLNSTELVGAKKVWFVMTCGSEIGNAAKYNRNLAEQKKICYMGTAQIIMPENYIAMFSAPQDSEAKETVNRAQVKIDDVISKIRCGQHFETPRNNLYDRFMSSCVNPIFYPLFVTSEPFSADDRCKGCGKCVELCPLNNIKLEDNKPEWGKTCTHCMACICYCPTKAIEYGNKSINKPRYNFERLGLN